MHVIAKVFSSQGLFITLNYYLITCHNGDLELIKRFNRDSYKTNKMFARDFDSSTV